MKIPENYPSLYVASIGINSVVLAGELTATYLNMENSTLDKIKVGGIWGDYEHQLVSIRFDSEDNRIALLQNLINKEVPFLYDDRQYPDAVTSIKELAGEALFHGKIYSVRIIVGYEIAVSYAEL